MLGLQWFSSFPLLFLPCRERKRRTHASHVDTTSKRGVTSLIFLILYGGRSASALFVSIPYQRKRQTWRALAGPPKIIKIRDVSLSPDIKEQGGANHILTLRSRCQKMICLTRFACSYRGLETQLLSTVGSSLASSSNLGIPCFTKITSDERTRERDPQVGRRSRLCLNKFLTDH